MTFDLKGLVTWYLGMSFVHKPWTPGAVSGHDWIRQLGIVDIYDGGSGVQGHHHWPLLH